MAMEEALVPHAKRLRIGRSNFRLLSDISSKESTLQLATATVYHHSIRFKMDNKKHIVNLESFRDMLHICPRLPGQSFIEPPFEEEIITFLRFLRHSEAIRKLTDVNINKLHQLWRSFAAIINKCLTGKSLGYDSLRFTKIIIHHFMSKDPSIPRRNKVNWHYVRDHHMFTTVKLVSRHQNTQQLGALLPIELTNEDIRNSNAYKEYYAVATGATPPKLKARNDGDDDEGDDDGNDEEDDSEEGDDDDDHKDEGNDENDQEEGSDDEQTSNEEEFIHPSLSTHAKEEPRDEESFDPILKTPKNTNDEGNGMELIFETASQMDVQTPTSLATLPMSAPTLTPSTIATITTTIQAPTPPTTALSTLLQDLPNFGSLFGFDNRLKTLEANFYEFMQTNQFAGAVSSIPGIVQRYMDQPMNKAVKVAVQIQSDQIRDEAQAENDEFLKTIDENMQKIIKEQVKEQVKVQVSKILSKIEQTVNEQVEAEFLTRSSNSSKTSYEPLQALVEAYESDKIILDTYGDTITLKRRRDDDVDKDEEPSAGSDRGSKRRREGKEPESASAPKEKATMSAGKSTQGSKSRQTSASESATAKEPMQTTFEMEELSHPEFETGADDQPIVQPSQHPEWFSQQKKPPNPDLDTLIPKLLADPTYELMKESCKSLVEIKFFLEEVYKATTDQLDWVNPEGASSRKYITSITKTKAADYGHIKWIEDLVPKTMWIQEPVCYDKHALWGIAHWGRKLQQFYDFAVNRESTRDVYSKRRIIAVTELKIVEWHNYKHLDWITLTNLTVEERFAFNVSHRMFIRSIIIQRRVEDLQLGVESYQKKLNLTRSDTYRSDLKCKEAYSAYSNPRGFIYQNKDKKNRLMRIDELHKFSDGTLTDVHTALDDHYEDYEELEEACWRKAVRERLQDASKDHMIYHMLSLSFKRKLKDGGEVVEVAEASNSRTLHSAILPLFTAA
nr:hypothetical protein [Tanacetum cinerariifolium]